MLSGEVRTIDIYQLGVCSLSHVCIVRMFFQIDIAAYTLSVYYERGVYGFKHDIRKASRWSCKVENTHTQLKTTKGQPKKTKTRVRQDLKRTQRQRQQKLHGPKLRRIDVDGQLITLHN